MKPTPLSLPQTNLQSRAISRCSPELEASIRWYVDTNPITSCSQCSVLTPVTLQCVKSIGYYCILTQITVPSVVTIFPFEDMAASRHFGTISRGLCPVLEHLLGFPIGVPDALAAGFLNSENATWNKLAMHPQLCEWFRLQFFGLKCLKIQQASDSEDGKHILKLQFHWMLKMPATFKRETFNALEAKDIFRHIGGRDWKTYGDPKDIPVKTGNRIAIKDPNCPLHWVRNGQIFYVSVNTKEEASMMKWALNFRFALTLVATMSHLAATPQDWLDNDLGGSAEGIGA